MGIESGGQRGENEGGEWGGGGGKRVDKGVGGQKSIMVYCLGGGQDEQGKRGEKGDISGGGGSGAIPSPLKRMRQIFSLLETEEKKKKKEEKKNTQKITFKGGV